MEWNEINLSMLEAACKCGDEGRSHLNEFCEFGAVKIGEQELDVDIVEEIYVPGYEPESPNSIILSLIAEIRQLRASSV